MELLMCTTNVHINKSLILKQKCRIFMNREICAMFRPRIIALKKKKKDPSLLTPKKVRLFYLKPEENVQ